jgi:DNA-binding XRE family transcriptional regulator
MTRKRHAGGESMTRRRKHGHGPDDLTRWRTAISGEMAVVRAWRLAQRGSSGGVLSQRELAGLVGVSVGTIGEVERGERPPSYALRARLWSLMQTGVELAPSVSGRARRRLKREAGSEDRQLFLPLVGEPEPELERKRARTGS